MPRLIVLGLAVVALVILALQNLSLSLPLVILGQPTAALPLSLWLLGAIAIGAICALLIFGLASVGQPPRSGYRPMGRRVPYPSGSSSAGPETTGSESTGWPSGPAERTADIPTDTSTDASSRFAAEPVEPSYPAAPPPQNRDSADWDSFRPPERWDSWEQSASSEPAQAEPGSNRAGSNRDGFFGRRADSAGDSVSQIEQGWNEDESDYQPDQSDYRPSDAARPRPDDLETGWEAFEENAEDELEQRPKRTYRDNLYDADDSDYDRLADRSQPNWEEDIPESSDPDDAEIGAEMGPDGVYDADYRVIVPPHRPLDQEPP